MFTELTEAAGRAARHWASALAGVRGRMRRRGARSVHRWAAVLRRTRGAVRALWARTVGRWWEDRSVGFRRTIRTLGMLIATSALSLSVGLATATATSPWGPHEATWATTLDSTLTLDLGPLGMVSMDSPAGVLGVEVTLGEIPSQMGVSAVDATTLGETLNRDAQAYVAVVSHPELTIGRGLRALADDALRRAVLMESIILCLVAAGRLASGGRLRDTVRLVLGRGPASALLGTVSLACVVALVAPQLRAPAGGGQPVAALAGTALEGVRMSGRVADVVAAYGTEVTAFLEDNEAFYSQAQENLRVAWAASEAAGGVANATASQGQVDQAAIDAQVQEVTGRQARGLTKAAAQRAQDAAPTGQPATAATATATRPAAGGAWALAGQKVTTVVLSTDLHCNLDVIAFSGVLDEIAGADIHMDDGDLTMTGSDPEQVCVDALTKAVPAGVARVATLGNHDSPSIGNHLRAQGWTVTDGTVQEVGGLRVIGDDDPERTTATGTVPAGTESAQDVGARLAEESCRAGGADVVLIHQPYTFGPLIERGCAPLLLAGHVHQERGMSTAVGANGEVTSLISGAAKGGTSLGPVTEDAYLHVLAFDDQGFLVAWRTVVLHTDASVTVGAWRPVPTAEQSAAGQTSAEATPQPTPTPSSTGAPAYG